MIQKKFCEELGHIVSQYLKYNMRILLDLNANVGRENIFKLIIWNETLHKTIHGNGIRTVNFTKSRNMSREAIQYFLITTFVKTFGCFLIGRYNQIDDMDYIQVYSLSDLLEDLTVVLMTI